MEEKKAILITTVSGRVSARTRSLAETAATLRGLTLSAFVADAVDQAARHELTCQAAERRGTTMPPERS
jgi:uncharacterized protein (DUF1778 family)